MDYFLQDSIDSIVVLNVSTEIKLDLIHSYLYGSLPSKIVYYLTICVVHLLGPILLVGIVIFETFGGDPQKRNIINRLHSLAISHQIIFTIIVGISRVCREIFGLIDVSIMAWIESISQLFVYSAVFFVDEMITLRFLYVVVWKRVRRIDDQFWACYLALHTWCWSFCCAVIEHIPTQMNIHVFKVNTKNLGEDFESTRYLEFVLQNILDNQYIMLSVIKILGSTSNFP